MDADEQNDQGKSDREKFLEEIRRRAEEAELKRLEEDETDDGGDSPADLPVPEPPQAAAPSTPQDPVPFSVTPPDQSTLAPKAVREQKILVLRERLGIALDRGRVDKAAELLEELSELVPDSPDLAHLRDRLASARQGQAPGQEKRRPVSSIRPSGDSTVSRDRRTTQKKLIELLETAGDLYQQEKYDKALASVEELLAADPEHEEGQKLRQQIQKAQRIADLIKREEARSKAERASMRAEEPERPPVVEKGGDPWGSSEPVPPQETGLELPPEEKGPVGPPKPPVMNRIANKVSRVRIPVKPILTIVLVLVAALLTYFVVDNIRNAVIPPSTTILVYPGVALSGDSTVSWTVDGLTDELIRDLTAVTDLRVFGSGTTVAFKGTQREVLKTARGLGANFAFQLGVVRSGEHLLLQPALYDTLEGKAIWNTQIETTVRELAAVRQEIVRRVLAFMQVKPTVEEDAVIGRSGTSNPEAYDVYLHGRALLAQPGRTMSGEAIRVLTQAVGMDSLFPDAQAALGWAYVRAYEADRGAPQRYLDEARIRVQRAASLAPRNAEAFRVWGVVEYYRSARRQAVERLQQGLGIAPGDPESQRRLALAMLALGDPEEAKKSANQAIRDDPGEIDSYVVLGQVYQFSDEFGDAARAYEQGSRLASDRSEYSSGALVDVLVFMRESDRAIAILNDRLARARDSFIDYYKLGRVQQTAGKPKAEWTASLERAKVLVDDRLRAAPQDPGLLSWKALIHTRLGEFREALAAVKAAEGVDPEDPRVLYNGARMYALQRDREKAFTYLRRAVARRYDLARIMDMDFYNLRRDEEFIRIVSG